MNKNEYYNSSEYFLINKETFQHIPNFNYNSINKILEKYNPIKVLDDDGYLFLIKDNIEIYNLLTNVKL